jgi:hypothetical protein
MPASFRPLKPWIGSALSAERCSQEGISIKKTFLVLTIFLLFLVGLVFFHLSTSGLEYSRYNTNWNGTSRIFDMAEEHGATEILLPQDLSAYSDALLLVIEPNGTISADEGIYYRAFLIRGNTIFIAGKGEGTNQLLENLGSTVRIQEGTLLSLDSAYTTPASVVAYRAHDDPLLPNISSLVLNNPSALTGGSVLFQSSVLSWIDRNGDQKVNADETMQSYPVLVREQIGTGTLYVLSDPGIFLNAMGTLDRGDNAASIEALFSNRTVLLEQVHSRTTAAETTIRILQYIRNTTIIKIALVLSVLIPVVYFLRKKGADDNHE